MNKRHSETKMNTVNAGAKRPVTASEQFGAAASRCDERGMSFRAKASIVLFFISFMSIFMCGGWCIPTTAEAAITYQTPGAVVYSTSGGTTVSPVHPATITANDLLVLVIGMKPSTANVGTVTTPAGWTAGPSITAAGGYGTTLGADTGNTNLFTYYKTAGGTEGGTTLTVTIGTNNVSWAQIYRYTNNTGAWSVAGATGEDSSGDVTVSIAFGTDPGVSLDDHILAAMCIPTDATTPNQFSNETFTQGGVTFEALVTPEISEPDNTIGNDIGGFVTRGVVTAGTSTGSPTMTADATGTVTNVRGPGVFLRIREVITLTLGDGTTPSNKNPVYRNDTNQAINEFTLVTDGGTATVSEIVVTNTASGGSGATETSAVKIYEDTGSTLHEWDSGDTLIASTTFATNTATFSSLSIPVTTTSKRYIVTYDISATATAARTLQAQVSGITSTAATNTDNDTNDATLTIGTLTLTAGDGTDPAGYAVYRTETNRTIDVFTLSMTAGSTTVSQIVVTGTATGFDSSTEASAVKLWQDTGSTANLWDAGDTLIASTTFATNTATFSGLSIPVTTTSATYIVTVDISATATATRTVTAQVSGITSPAQTETDNDTGGTTLTVTTHTLTAGDGTDPTNYTVYRTETDKTIDVFTLSMNAGSTVVSQIVVTGTATGLNSSTEASAVKLWQDTGSTANQWDAGDTLIASTTFATNTATFSGLSIPVTTTAVTYIVTVDISATATATRTVTAQVSGITSPAQTETDNDTGGTTLTIGTWAVNVADGTDPSNGNVEIGSSGVLVDGFTMATNVMTATVTTVATTVTGNTYLANIKLYKDDGDGIYDAGDTLLGTVASPGATASFSGLSESLTTTATTYWLTVDVASGAVAGQSISADVSSLTVTAPVLQGTVADAGATLTTVCIDHAISSIVDNTAVTTAAGDFNGSSLFTLADITGAEYRVTAMSAGGTDTVTLHTVWAQVASGAATGTYPASNIAAGNNRMLVVAYGAENGTVNLALNTSTATYGGQPMTLVVTSDGSASTRRQTALFICNDACISAAVAANNRTLTVTPSPGTPTAADQAIHAAVYQGVDQTTPYTNTLGIGYDIGGGNVANVSAADNGGVVVEEGGMYIYSEISTNTSQNFAAIAGFTEILQTNTASAATATGYRNTTTAATITTSSTNTAALTAICAMALRPATLPPVETELIAWNPDAQEATAAGLVNGNTYTIYARGYDLSDTCNANYIYAGGGASPGTGKTFTWNSCSETKTLTLNAVADPLSGTTASISATGTAGTIKVDATTPPLQNSPWTYPIPQDSTASVTFYAQGTGDCGTLTRSQTVTLATMAKPVVTAFTIPATVVDPAAPLLIPITTFTATDNSGTVTGYKVTESATAPLPGDAGWTGTAPTTYTVAAYGPYTLYAWAKDAAGNVSLSASASTTVTNCSPTVTALAISATPNPIDNSAPRTSTITLTATGGTVSSPQWSDDGGTSWYPTSTLYTAPTQSVGSVNITGRATESTCGTVIPATNQPYALSYDTRTPGLTTQTASGAQASMNSITVTMPYLGDKDGDATFQVNYKLSTGTWTTGTPVNPSPEVNPYTVTISSLTADSTYNFEVIYADPDGVTGTATQTFNVTLVSWVDNFLLHNSNRFSCDKSGYFRNEAECEAVAVGGTWTLDKWGKPWGTSDATDQYGPIMCSTCHGKNSPNIKRIKGTITAAKNSFPGGTVAATSSIANTSSDYGDDSAGHATSTRVCESCHSQNKYHNYDTANNTTDPDRLTHYNNKDCISCHEHEGGFRASCNACHGNPPVVDTKGGPTGLVNNPGITGSTTAGKHVRHVTDASGPQYTCEKCHSSPFGSGPNHTFSKAVTVSFEAFGSTAGTYNGQSTVTTYDGSVGAKDNSLTCAATYCHGGTIGGATPTWKAIGTAACGSCHGATAASPPASPASSLSHQTHAGTGGGVDAQNSTGLTGTVLACSACHGANGTGAIGHLDGKTQFNVVTLTSDYRAAATTVKYKTVQSGDSGALAKVNPYSTCTNSACHWGTTTPAWNSGPANCGTCHPASPTSGKHSDHTTASATYVTCDNCHGTGAKTGTHAGHINGSVNFYATINTTDNNLDTTDFVGEATRGDTRDDTCAAVCHKDGDWGDGSVATTATVAANKGTLDWTVDCSSVPVVDACTDCHSGIYSGKAGPTVIKSWATTPTGSHLKALKTDTIPGNACGDVTTWKNLCNKCHTKHGGTVQIPLPPTSWDNPGTAAVETSNMRTQLGISYAGADHGAIKLGGTATSGTTEANVCWSCHDAAANTVSEWAYNTDTNSATFPTTTIADRDGGSVGSHNYGWVYTSQAARDANTVASRTSAWVDASGNGYWHRDGYSTVTRLQRRITSVHSGSFTAGVSSVSTSVNATTGVVTAATQETPANIRCSYCHDVHDLNLAASDSNTGKPYLRGSWMGNPYAPDLPPVSTDVYPASNAGANAYMFTSTTAYAGKPRLFSTSTQKGGYFLDANSGRPTTNASYDTLGETAGVCTLCHGTDVDNMDFYPNSNAATKMWRSDQVNGHANSTLGGSGASHANARKLFDARRGTAANPSALPVYMGAQDVMWLRVTSLNPNFNYGKEFYTPNDAFTSGTISTGVPAGSNAVGPQNNAPHRTWNPSQPANSGHTGLGGHPARIIGWYGGTAKGNVTNDNQSTLPSEFFNWYSSTGIGTDGSGSGRAHSFTCSKCHTPHSSGLPALLTTNCLDTKVSTWGTTAYGPNATGTFGQRVAVTCHRNEGTTTGWHKLAVNQ